MKLQARAAMTMDVLAMKFAGKKKDVREHATDPLRKPVAEPAEAKLP